MSDPQTPNVDAVVIGAGFGGIYTLHKLRNGLGLKVRAYEKAGGVGGTWYWNKYPGALSDTEAHIHQYSFAKGIRPADSWGSRRGLRMGVGTLGGAKRLAISRYVRQLWELRGRGVASAWPRATYKPTRPLRAGIRTRHCEPPLPVSAIRI